MNIQEMIMEKSKELAQKHAEIIEIECKNLCSKFDVGASELIISYKQNNEITIDIRGVHFQINNEFTFKGE